MKTKDGEENLPNTEDSAARGPRSAFTPWRRASGIARPQSRRAVTRPPLTRPQTLAGALSLTQDVGQGPAQASTLDTH